jgi:predicted nucleic acid-binding protein
LDGLRLFNEKNVDIVDAIVFATASVKGWSYYSFDQDMRKLEK